MATAVILINTDPGDTAEVAERLSQVPGISEVYSVAGNWDLVSIVRVSTSEEVSDVVVERVRKTPGVVRTETLIAFRTYSRRDLESLFNLD